MLVAVGLTVASAQMTFSDGWGLSKRSDSKFQLDESKSIKIVMQLMFCLFRQKTWCLIVRGMLRFLLSGSNSFAQKNYGKHFWNNCSRVHLKF